MYGCGTADFINWGFICHGEITGFAEGVCAKSDAPIYFCEMFRDCSEVRDSGGSSYFDMLGCPKASMRGDKWSDSYNIIITVSNAGLNLDIILHNITLYNTGNTPWFHILYRIVLVFLK